MTLIYQSTNFIQNLKRPVGLSLALIFIVFFAGILPLVAFADQSLSTIYRRYVAQYQYKTAEFNFEIFMFLIVTTIVIAGVCAWFGNNKARYIFLVAATIFYAVKIFSFNSLMIEIGISTSDLESTQWNSLRYAIRIFAAVALCWWAFHTKKANRFFQSNNLASAPAGQHSLR